MQTTRSRSCSSVLIVLALLLCAHFAQAQESSQKTPLSEKLRLIIDKDGIEAAEQWFEETYPEQSDRYEVDYEGFVILAGEYMAAGDYESGTMVMTSMTVAGQDAMSAPAMMPSGAATATGEQQEAQTSGRASPSWERPRARTARPGFTVYTASGDRWNQSRRSSSPSCAAEYSTSRPRGETPRPG